jgi:hypothetical protein
MHRYVTDVNIIQNYKEVKMQGAIILRIQQKRMDVRKGGCLRWPGGYGFNGIFYIFASLGFV